MGGGAGTGVVTTGALAVGACATGRMTGGLAATVLGLRPSKRIRCPGYITWGGAIPLRCASSFQSQPKRKAIDHSVSPRWTMYCPAVTRSRLFRSTTCTPLGGELAQPASSVAARAVARRHRTDGYLFPRTTAVGLNGRSLGLICSDALRRRLMPCGYPFKP